MRMPCEWPMATMRAFTELERAMVDTMYLHLLSGGAGSLSPSNAKFGRQILRLILGKATLKNLHITAT